MGLFFNSKPQSAKDKEIAKIKRQMDELDDAIAFGHNEDDIDEDTYQLHQLEKKLEKLKKQR